MKIVAIINARSGSKGIPEKNIKKMCGKPLIEWTINIAKREKKIDRIYVSTDSKKIAEISIKLGAEVPFLRPKYLAKDDTPGIAPVLDMINKIKDIENVVLLQPTSPLRSKVDLDKMLKYAITNKAKSVVSLTKVKDAPELMYFVKKNNGINKLINKKQVNRQNFLNLYKINGAIYFANVKWLLKNKKFVTKETKSYIMPLERSVDIDDYYDWNIAKYFLSKKIKK